jgi:hypothetical protein
VPGRDTDYLVLWQPATDDAATVDVRYIGADVF